MIRLNAVRKRFGGRGPEAVRGVTLAFGAGEAVGVAGPNGAGKSTLLALTLGFLRPTAGTVTIDGLEPRAFLRDRGAGWVPEKFSLPGAWRVRGALEHFARLDGDRSRATVPSALAHFGLEPWAEQPAAALSHGLGRRLALAIATLTPHPLVVLDEPTEGLDADGRERFRERCAWLRGHGCTLLLASQDLAEIDRVADRRVLLKEGIVCEDAALRPASGRHAYRVTLAQPFERFAEFFPGAQPEPAGAPQAIGAAFRVTVTDAADLGARLRGLLGAGALLSSVSPTGSDPAGRRPSEPEPGTRP